MAVAGFGLLPFLQANPVQAQGFGDPDEGRKIAAANCSSCHEMGPGTLDPDAASIPSFQAIAAMPSTTMIAISVFLRTSHDVMPNLRLTERQISDIGAYILSLRGAR
ncbi:MAG: c-type cytochrome [Bradyrhizobium sp.]